MKELEALAESAGFGPDFESAALTVWQSVPSDPEVVGSNPSGAAVLSSTSPGSSLAPVLAYRTPPSRHSRHSPISPIGAASSSARVLALYTA